MRRHAHTRRLLQHYELSLPLVSFHEHNEKRRLGQVLQDLRAGRDIALVSDGGTPLINDPGFTLVRACHEEGLPLTALPGPCAAVSALALSGLATHRFQFVGFLPRKKGARQRMLAQALTYPGTTIAYESPHRLVTVLGELAALDPCAGAAVARELTKQYEELRRGDAAALLTHYQSHPPRGEIVLLIGGAGRERADDDESA